MKKYLVCFKKVYNHRKGETQWKVDFNEVFTEVGNGEYRTPVNNHTITDKAIRHILEVGNGRYAYRFVTENEWAEIEETVNNDKYNYNINVDDYEAYAM